MADNDTDISKTLLTKVDQIIKLHFYLPLQNTEKFALSASSVNRLNNSVLEDKGVLEMDFGANKTPVEVIKEDAFGRTYFRDIYSGVTGKWYKKSWKEFDQLKNIDQKFYCSSYYDVSVNKYGFKCGTSLRFWENKGWINERPLWLVSVLF